MTTEQIKAIQSRLILLGAQSTCDREDRQWMMDTLWLLVGPTEEAQRATALKMIASLKMAKGDTLRCPPQIYCGDEDIGEAKFMRMCEESRVDCRMFYDMLPSK